MRNFMKNMSPKNKLAAGIAGLVLLLLLASSAYHFLLQKPAAQAPDASSDTSAASQETAPDFTVQDASGKEVSLSSYQGSPVVLNFWASWCPPCKAEMPDYEKLYQTYREKGVVFMMVNLTDGDRETLDTAKTFLSKSGYTFPVYFDTKLTAAQAYSLSSIPDSFFIGRDGKIVHAYQGMIDADTMKRSVEDLLK